jgi:hypothetical protein
MAYDMLSHLYGGKLVEPQANSKTPLIGQMLLFDQDAFMDPPSSLIASQNARSAMSEWIQKSMTLYNPTNWEWSTSGLFNITMKVSSKANATTTRSSSAGFDGQGFVYFPSACANGQKCPIHVALHGCQQGLHRYSFSFLLLNIFLFFSRQIVCRRRLCNKSRLFGSG